MDFSVFDLGLMDYFSCLDRQKGTVTGKIANPGSEDVLFLVEHPSVFTLGKRGGRNFLRISEEELKNRGMTLAETERGGFITYHGPGQLVAYPIFRISDRKLGVRAWVSFLESVMIACAKSFGVEAHATDAARGVWAENRKLGSIGVSLHHGVSFHGLALNVSLDLAPFSWIAPCGMDIPMTSLEKECGRPIPMNQVKEDLIRTFTALCPPRYI